MRNVLLASLLLLSGCSDVPVENQMDSTEALTSGDTSAAINGHLPPRSALLDTVKESEEKQLIRPSDAAISEMIRQLAPLGWDIMDTATGDLNRDQYLDMLMIIRDEQDSIRDLLILVGDPENDFTLAERNDSVVLCYLCGGVTGDPYMRMVIKNGYFTVEHYGGSSIRWSRYITFKYRDSEQTWYLHREAGEVYNINLESAEEQYVEREDEYGKLKFVDYNYN